jgi:hypothetical protein
MTSPGAALLVSDGRVETATATSATVIDAIATLQI